ncbi:MAG: O-antigen ligase family protein [Agriterribacter sp.]
MNKRKTFTEYLAIISIFSIFLDQALRGVLPFDLYYYYPVFILFLITQLLQTGKIAILPSWFMIGLGVIFAGSVFITWFKNILGFELLKQVFGLVFTSLVYYNVLFVLKFDVKRIFNYYLVFAFWVALHGVIDNILHYVGIHLTKVNLAGPGLYREYGIMGEPFYLALALTPAIVYYLCYFKLTWKSKKLVFLVTSGCYLLTYSSIAVTGFVLGIFMSLYINNYFSAQRGKIILAPLLITPVILLTSYLVNNIGLINARFYDTTSLFLSSQIKADEAGKSNASTFALYTNYAIARDSFLESPLLGSGLGSHPIIYETTFLKYFPPRYLTMYGNQNQQDANSKFLRLMSETGLVGLILFFIAFIRFFASKRKMVSEELKNLGAINYAIFVYIVLCLIRNGNYINVGFFFFFFLYYVSWYNIQKGNIKSPRVKHSTAQV